MDSNVRLKALISDSDKKQKAIASEIGISPSTLSNYVTGVSKIPGDIAAKLAIYFNVTADYLLGLSDYPDVSAHNFRKKRAFFVKGATVAKKCINKSRTIRKKGRPALHFWC